MILFKPAPGCPFQRSPKGTVSFFASLRANAKKACPTGVSRAGMPLLQGSPLDHPCRKQQCNNLLIQTHKLRPIYGLA
ncbi:MAG TPA: hypothetical protein DIT07_00295 [Sphingobacteriaceae bacterium]|nr:hypothetical protein [Sphingobacteriaceae bacterium]